MQYEIKHYATIEEFLEGLKQMSKVGWFLDSWQEISEPDDKNLCFVVVYRGGRYG